MPGTPPTTSRLAIPRIATTDTDDVPRDLNAAVDQIDALAGRFESGLLAARPSTGAGIANRFYFATDDLSGGPSGTLYRDAGGATPTWQRITPANMEAAFSRYTPILRATGAAGGSLALGTYIIAPSDFFLISGTAGTARAAFWFDPALYAAGSRTVKLALRLMVVTNAVAPATSFTLNMNQISGITGGSGVSPGLTIGSAIAGSGVSINTPGASTIVQAITADFNAPSALQYALTVVVAGTTAAGSATQCIAELFVREV